MVQATEVEYKLLTQLSGVQLAALSLA